MHGCLSFFICSEGYQPCMDYVWCVITTVFRHNSRFSGELSLNVTKGIYGSLCLCVCTSQVPCGVQETVPGDAVPHCRWGGEPEGRRAAPIKLPLEPIVTVSETQGKTRKGGLSRLVIIYLKYQLLPESHAISACLHWAEVFQCWRNHNRAERSIRELMFYAPNFWSRKKPCLCLHWL